MTLKKKKNRRANTQEDELEEDLNNLSLDIDFPQSSVDSVKEIDLKELRELVEADEEIEDLPNSSIEVIQDEGCESTQFDVEEEEEHTEVEEEIEEPTAPCMEEEKAPATVKTAIEVPSIHTARALYDKTLYPDLSQVVVSTSAMQIAEKVLSPVAVKPFSPLEKEQLYSNRELQLIEMFEHEFVEKELKDTSLQDHPLYVLLKKYGKSRSRLLANSRNIASINLKLDHNYKTIWKLENRTFTNHNTCHCGKSVMASHSFRYAVFNEEVNAEMSKNLKELLNMSCFIHTKFSQDSELYRRQIQQMIGELMHSKAFANISQDSPIVLNEELVVSNIPELKKKIGELRLYISILFKFLRDAAHDKTLARSVQDWIRKLVSLQLRVATWQDHVFILFHILRCPVNVGNWAASLIQVPEIKRLPKENQSPFDYQEFQHCVAILSALLLPIKDRGTFLEGITKDLAPDPEVGGDVWVLVDSDGEEGSNASGECSGLKENDLVAIFDQIPMEMLFRLISLVEKKANVYELESEKISGYHIIRAIAFTSKFIAILKRGLTTYESDRYKQFAKRLGRLMRQTLFYVSDLIQIYRSCERYHDPEQDQRIQVEFDAVILQSARFIYECKKLAIFQYLVDYPFSLMSLKAIWKLYYYLHSGEPRVLEEETSHLSFQADFNTAFNDDIASDDLVFLIHAFGEMAMCKGSEDWEFARFVTFHLLQIGFIDERTKLSCHRTVRDTVVNITTKFPEMIGDIFAYLKSNLQGIGTYGSYLFKDLPIFKWIPKTEDLEVLASWLLNFDFDSLENSTARVIFAYMNWNFDESDELFLPHEIHIRMAFLVCEVYLKHIGEVIGSGVNDTARLVGSGKKNQTKKEQFSVWCWTMISVLRIHHMDLNKATVRSLMDNPAILNMIPELEATNAIFQGFTEQKPLAIYLSVLLTQLGHSIPQICHRGFDQLKFLLNDFRHSKVIRCLELITPLFVSCPSSLYTCESFMNILMLLFNADKTYSKMVKEAVSADPRGPVLTFFGNMIQHQITSFARYGWKSPSELVQLWVNCLIRLKDWSKEPGILWVLDIICQVAYQHNDAWTFTREILRPQVVRIVDTKVPKTTGLLNLISSEDKDILFNPTADASTLSLMLLELEFENIEMNTGFWSEFLCQLLIQNKVSLSTVLKKTLTAKQLPQFPYQSLSVFKFAKLILKMSPKHFIFPIVCQQFFSLFMHRVPGDISNDDFGVQDRFYDCDIGLMKKLKKIFQDSESLHSDMATNRTSGSDSQFHTHCAKLFKTYLLWLEETQINKMTQQNIILPPQYDHPRLKEIFRGSRDHWTEFILLKELNKKKNDCCNSWLTVCMRSNSKTASKVPAQASVGPISTEDAKSKLFERLKTQGIPLKAPELTRENTHIGIVDVSNSTLQVLRNESRILQHFASQFNLLVNEHKAIDSIYRDTIRNMYVNEQSISYKNVKCSKVFDNCQYNTAVRIESSEAKLIENVKNRLEENRDFLKGMLVREVKNPDAKIVDANFCLNNVIQQLLDQYEFCRRFDDRDRCNKILKIGTHFFYEVLNEINEDIQACPVTQELYTDTISKLGTFVQQNHNTEGKNLLKLALQRPNLVNLIAELFTPSVCQPQFFIEMYRSLVDSYAKRCDPQLLFVLFTKFDIPRWLELNKPKIIDVSSLSQNILRGLELWNLQNSELLQDLMRCHLVHLFLYKFPEHYGEILQSVLAGFSQQKIRPNVLLDIINAFYHKVGGVKLDPEMSVGRLKDELRNFASKQNILAYNEVFSTSIMIADHFYRERLQFGLHGLYPKFSEYCDVLCLLMGSIGHSAVASAIQAYPGMPADQLVISIWPCISGMFAPWLVPYYPQHMKDAPANWIQQFTSVNSVLQPWSDVHNGSAEKVIRVFAMSLQYVLDMLPASNLLLGHLFCWYDQSFAHKTTSKIVLTPIQTLLMKMPWERFRPAPIHMEGFNRILMDFMPECHRFIGNVFVRIAWTSWLQENLTSLDYAAVQRMMSILLMVFVKMAYEPKVRESICVLKILGDSLKYPWHLLEYKDVEHVLDWFVMSAEPSVVVKTSEHETIDSCVLSLLQTACCMRDMSKDSHGVQRTVITGKRMAYIRSVVRLLKTCDAKLHQLMTTKQGQEMFHQAVFSLLNTIDTSSCNDSTFLDVVNYLIPLTDGMAIPESTSKLFADAIGMWQKTCQTGSIMLPSFLGALRVQKQWCLGVFQVLESTLVNYMRVSDLAPEHNPSWPDAYQIFNGASVNFDHSILLNNDLFFATLLLCYTKIQALPDDFERVVFLQEVQKKLADRKTSEAIEARAVMLWGFLIMSGGHIKQRSKASENQLLITARYFQINIAQPDGWGDGLLGAIGLRKENHSNKKKILLRCLSVAIFSLFTGTNNFTHATEYNDSLKELKGALSNKKFSEIRMMGMEAVSLIESKKGSMINGFPDTVSKLIRIFYEDHFLNSIEYFYHW